MNGRLRDAARVIGTLADGLRRQLYLFVRERRRPVSRDEAARAVGISTKLAAFHLDKLVERGLLDFRYARPHGRTGPGAGRPAKLYEPSDLQVDVSIPERRYDRIAELLVRAVEDERPGERAHAAAVRIANEAGRATGQGVRADGFRPGTGRQSAMAAAEALLSDLGYEPFRETGRLVLRNCPFHPLAQQAPDVVCRMNHAYVEGILRGLGDDSLRATLDRAPERCCVIVEPPVRRRSPRRVA